MAVTKEDGKLTLQLQAETGMKRVYCVTTDRTLLDIARYIQADSYIDFKWDNRLICTDLRVVTGSHLTTK